MTAQPAPVAPESRLSKSSLISFITGLIFCVPFIGALALLSGIIGFFRSGQPGVRGRWMAIAGSILGLGNLVFWALFIGVISTALLAALGAAEAPKTASHDLVKALSERDIATAKSLAPDISEDQLEAVSEALQSSGKFVDTSFNNTSVVNNRAEISGTAKFTGRSRSVKTVLVYSGDSWKVTEITFGK
jgi:hypothetical protein